MMAERDLGRADLGGDAVEHAAPQPGAQRAHRAALGDHALDDAVRVLLGDAERHAARLEEARQHVGGKARLLLVEVDGDDLERERRAAFERQQDVEQAIAVLAAGQADHHAVVRRDQAVLADRLADLPAQALAELVGLELGLPRIAAADGRAGRGRVDSGCRRSVAGGVSMAPSFYRRCCGDWR